MLKKHDEKIVSAPKSRLYLPISIGFFGLLLLCSFAVIRGQNPSAPQQLHYTRLTTEAQREQGLSGRTNLPDNEAMLFVFEKPGLYCFWMKGMRFPIDMVWLDSDKRVIMIKENVQPESYPENFCPDSAAQYVVEVNAGVAEQAKMTQGSRLQF